MRGHVCVQFCLQDMNFDKVRLPFTVSVSCHGSALYTVSQSSPFVTLRKSSHLNSTQLKMVNKWIYPSNAQLIGCTLMEGFSFNGKTVINLDDFRVLEYWVSFNRKWTKNHYSFVMTKGGF